MTVFNIFSILDTIKNLIANSGFLTETEVIDLINASDSDRKYTELILDTSTVVIGGDPSWYLNESTGMSVSEGGAYWDGYVYNITEEGNYQVNINIRSSSITDELQCYIDVLNGEPLETKYILDSRNSTVTLPKTAVGKKIRFGVFSPIGDKTLIGCTNSDRLLIDFETFNLGPISNSSSMTIQGDWSGGAQTYFQNDSTDDESIVSTRSLAPGSQSWFTGNTGLYGNPSQGSPYTPKLPSEISAVDESAFNIGLRGQTYKARFWFYSPISNDGDNSILKVYNGSYDGTDRTGFNLNIKKTPGTMSVTSFTWDGVAFNEITLENNLSYDQWHHVEIVIVYDINGNPSGDVFTYQFDGGSIQNLQSWPNTWRVSNGFTPVYGTRLAFATTSSVSGFYIDSIDYVIEVPSIHINTCVQIYKI